MDIAVEKCRKIIKIGGGGQKIADVGDDFFATTKK